RLFCGLRSVRSRLGGRGVGGIGAGDLGGTVTLFVALLFLVLLHGRAGLLCRLSREGVRDVLDRLGEFTRDHPERVAVALGQVWQGFQVLVGEQLGVGIVLVHGLEDPLDRLGLTVGAQDGGLLVALGFQDRLLSGTFGGEDA